MPRMISRLELPVLAGSVTGSVALQLMADAGVGFACVGMPKGERVSIVRASELSKKRHYNSPIEEVMEPANLGDLWLLSSPVKFCNCDREGHSVEHRSGVNGAPCDECDGTYYCE